jgi:hexaprenyl-diphosphate synthase
VEGSALDRFVSKYRRQSFDLDAPNAAHGSASSVVEGLLHRTLPSFAPSAEDPMKAALRLVEKEIKSLNGSIQQQIEAVTERPLLAKVASYFFKLQGKRIRPVLVLLTSKAIAAHLNHHQPLDTDVPVSDRQFSLAEIMEMIHTASLMHDDIIDQAETRRGMPAAHKVWDSKKAVLAGDFLLARASVKIARLREHEVTELLSTMIADLVEGEFYQMRTNVEKEGKQMTQFDYYMRKTYLKTASLLEKCCSCAAILGEADRATIDVAKAYGAHLGYAFQLVDDMLDFTGTSSDLGKPAAVDLSLGLATAPVLFAMEEFGELRGLVERGFKEEGDVEKAFSLVQRSQGIARTHALAKEHCDKAVEAIGQLAPSPYRDALARLTEKVLSRSH